MKDSKGHDVNQENVEKPLLRKKEKRSEITFQFLCLKAYQPSCVN